MSIYADLLEKIETTQSIEDKLEAIAELGEIGDETVLEVLVSLTDNSVHRIRFAACSAINEIRQRIGEDFVRVGMKLTDEKGDFSPDLFELALGHDHFMFRMSAIKAAVSLRSPDAVPIIKDYLKREENSFVRSVGVKAMAHIGGEASVDSLVFFLNDKSPRVRSNTIEALTIASDTYYDLIKNMVKDNDYRVKSTAARHLHPKKKELILTYLTAMAKGDHAHKGACIWCLEKIKSPHYNEALRIIALSNSEFKSRAEVLLKNLGGNESGESSQKGAKGMSSDYTVDKRVAQRAIEAKSSTFMFFVKMILSILLLLGVAYGSLIGYERYNLENDYKRAKVDMMKKDFSKAKVRFQTLGNYKDSAQLLKIVEKNARSHEAETAYKSGKYADALDLYRKLISDHIETEKSKKGEYNSLRALIDKAINEARLNDAVAWIDKGLVSYPDDNYFERKRETIQIERGLILEKQELFLKAIEYFDNLGEKFPKYDLKMIKDRLAFKYADKLERAGNPEKALEMFKKQYESIFISQEELKKSIEQNYALIIENFLKDRQSEKALALAEKAYNELPGDKLENVKIKAMKAEVERLSTIRKFDRAALILHQALRIKPDDSTLKELSSKLSKLGAASGGDSNSIESYRQSLKALKSKYRVEKSPEVWAALSKTSVELSEKLLNKPALEEASVELKHVLEIIPGDKPVKVQLAKLYYLRGDEKYIMDDFDQAERYFRLSLEYNEGQDAKDALEKCRIKDIFELYLQGDYKSAVPGFRDILKKTPNDKKALKGLSLCLTELAEQALRKNDPEKAFELCSQAWKVKKDTENLSDKYLEAGMLINEKYVSKGDFDNSRKLLSDLREKFPDNENIKAAITGLYIKEAENKKLAQLKLLAGEQEKQQRLEAARELMKEREALERTKMTKQMQYRKKVIFECKDPAGDDRGPGSYTYPDNEDLDAGDLDILEVKILNESPFVEVRVTFANEIDTQCSSSNINQGSSRGGRRTSAGWRKGENGWVFQLIDIYIDTDNTPGSGHEWALPGRNVKFSSVNAWDKVILITPRSQPEVKSFINKKADNSNLLKMKRDIIVPKSYSVQGSTIVARIPASDLGPIDLDWRFQVFSLCYVENDTPEILFNQQIAASRTNVFFGGASSFEGNPNVLDILMPAGRNQFTELSKYRARPDKNQNVYPIVPMIDWNNRTR